MSKRPWPENAYPSAEQLLEWCRTGMTTDVEPYLRHLIDDHAAVDRVRELRDRWRREATYGPWNRTSEYEHRVTQLNGAIDGTLPALPAAPPQEVDES
jgi:hypothetical protein